ncbi:MAG TPA: cupredoxin domain-containing protein [Actinomycetota bacterium]|nr:cupredoxin domain-containing protein [Actinomycetota bacterium]
MHRIHNGKHFGKGLVALSALAVLGLAACGGGGNDPEASSGGSSESGSSSTSVTAKEYKFNPSDITVDASPFTLELKNEGTIEHDVSVKGTDVVILAKASEAATGEVELDPGTYTFFCSVPGHREEGMEGTLTVEG